MLLAQELLLLLVLLRLLRMCILLLLLLLSRQLLTLMTQHSQPIKAVTITTTVRLLQARDGNLSVVESGGTSYTLSTHSPTPSSNLVSKTRDAAVRCTTATFILLFLLNRNRGADI
jgi:hypothetical protein